MIICAADVTDREQSAVITVAEKMGPLRGIMHAAMVLDDAPIERLTEERMWKAMAPKIIGAWNLHTLTIDASLDFFVLFSSIAAIVGNPGQANYVAGNAFLDALAYYRRARGLPALAVNWGVLGEVGHVSRSPDTAERLQRLGLKAMPLSEALDALDELMSSDAVQVAVAHVEWKSLLRSTGSPSRRGIAVLSVTLTPRRAAPPKYPASATYWKRTRRRFRLSWKVIFGMCWPERWELRRRASICGNRCVILGWIL